jgi:hypothetical protein
MSSYRTLTNIVLASLTSIEKACIGATVLIWSKVKVYNVHFIILNQINTFRTISTHTSIEPCENNKGDFLRWLIKFPGFEMEPRDRSCLPNSFPKDIPGTCYFLHKYTHPGTDPTAPQVSKAFWSKAKLHN